MDLWSGIWMQIRKFFFCEDRTRLFTKTSTQPCIPFSRKTLVTYTNRDITVIESFCSVLRHKLRTNIQHINNTTRHFLSLTQTPLTSKKPLSKGEGRRGMSGGGEGLGVRSSPSCLQIKIELCCFFQYARQKCIFFSPCPS